MTRTRIVVAATAALVVSVFLLGCSLCQVMTDSAGKLFGGSKEATATGTDTSGTVVETQLPPPPGGPSQEAGLIILTQRRGNRTRTQILDAVRNYSGMGDERGARFVVLWLAKKGYWAMMQGRTEDEGTEVEALLRWTSSEGRWRLIGFSTAGWKQVTAAGYPKAPREVFSGARAWPKEPTGSGGGGAYRNLTNRKGDPTRTAILDAVRANMGWEIDGRKIVFTVKWLAVQDGWAYFVGEEYNVKLPLDVLLRRTGGGWRVVVTQGEGDFEQTIRQAHPEAPQAIFDGYR